jgi:hypothetical protein
MVYTANARDEALLSLALGGLRRAAASESET